MHAHRCVVVPRVPDKHEAVVAETNPRCRRLSKALGMNDICDGVGLSAVTAGAVLARLRSAVLARLRVVLKHVCDLLSEAEESKASCFRRLLRVGVARQVAAHPPPAARPPSRPQLTCQPSKGSAEPLP